MGLAQPAILLREYLHTYATSRNVRPTIVERLGLAVGSLERWNRSTVSLTQLSDDLLNRWIEVRLSRGDGLGRIRREADAIMDLWRGAVADRLVESKPRRVKVVSVPPPAVEAYTEEDLRAVVAACADVPGTFGPWGIDRALYLRAYALTAAYSGLATESLRALRKTDLQANGIRLRQARTHQTMVLALHPSALQAIGDTFPPKRETIFPLSATGIDYWWRFVCRKAGVPGNLDWLRTAGCIAAETVEPGNVKGYTMKQSQSGVDWTQARRFKI